MAGHALTAMATRRIQKELERFAEPGAGLSVAVLSPTVWIVTLRGVEDTLYAGEEFDLRVTFDGSYPMECPEVVISIECVVIPTPSDYFSVSVRTDTVCRNASHPSTHIHQWPHMPQHPVRGLVSGSHCEERLHVHSVDAVQQ